MILITKDKYPIAKFSRYSDTQISQTAKNVGHLAHSIIIAESQNLKTTYMKKNTHMQVQHDK